MFPQAFTINEMRALPRYKDCEETYKSFPCKYIMATQATLSREQQRAFAVFLQYRAKLHNLVHLSCKVRPKAPLLPTDFIASSYQEFQKANLPREDYWTWNQSNAKVMIKVDAQCTVTLRKVSPIKLGLECAPSYKIWLYNVCALSSPDQFFLWCEKGEDEIEVTSNGINTEIGTIFPHQVSLDQLSFLHPFVDKQTAIEFGWCR